MSQSDRHEWLFLQVLPPPSTTGITNLFKLHNKPWKLLTCIVDDWYMVTIVCMSHQEEEWDVRVSIVDESGKEITVSKAEESKQYNTYKVYELIHASQFRLIEEKVMKSEVSLIVEIKIKENEKTQIKKSGKFLYSFIS